MATATTEAPAQAEKIIVNILKDESMPVKKLLEKIKSPLILAQAWSAGDVEFGRRTHVHNGPVNKPDRTTIIVEQSWAWSGPKTTAMKGFRDLIAEDDRLPKAKEYREYPAPPVDAEDKKDDPNAPCPLVAITMEQAHTMIGLHVRLTDKGLAALQAA